MTGTHRPPRSNIYSHPLLRMIVETSHIQCSTPITKHKNIRTSIPKMIVLTVTEWTRLKIPIRQLKMVPAAETNIKKKQTPKTTPTKVRRPTISFSHTTTTDMLRRLFKLISIVHSIYKFDYEFRHVGD